MPTPLPLLLLALAAFAAGFIDAVVGGGGLITMPALLLGMPGAPLPVVLGNNKVQAGTGTTVAAWKFLRSGAMTWRDAVGPVIAAMIGAVGGALLAYRIGTAFMRPLMLGLMGVMLLWTLLKPDLGQVHAPKYGLHHQRGLAILIALALGFYDGFFGPGTGSLLIFLFVAVLGFDFLRASALAKAVNWASNMAALAVFLARGSWTPMVGLTMAVGNGAGGWLGAHVALKKGSAWVRIVFLAVVSALLVRLTWQVFKG
ncbi:MAG: TSUP family transporter [Acidobacteria bacterium]|nr:TSUP family transporter [Acidobacteriota bacterium]